MYNKNILRSLGIDRWCFHLATTITTTMMTNTRATPPIILITSNEIAGVTEDCVDVVGDVWVFAPPGKYERK